MNKPRDLILKLYKEDRITKEDTDILLDAIICKSCCTYQPNYLPYGYSRTGQSYIPEHQPKWTITSNTDSAYVE